MFNMIRKPFPGSILVLLIVSLSPLNAQESDKTKLKDLPRYDLTVLLETTSETSANVAFGDLDGDGNLDILLAKGRHWPLVNRVLFGDGKGGVLKSYDLETVADRSYSGRLADLDEDGDLDVVASNDKPDANLVYLNDGKGNFQAGSTFGRAEWPTRNANVADLNNDGLPDIVVANRSRGNTGANYLCINKGNGEFEADCIAFSRYPATTITPADFNGDGLVDLAVPHRNGGQSFVYIQTDKAGFDFMQIPFGSPTASIRISQAADFDNDGRMDLVTIDTNKGVIIYFQHTSDSFSSGMSIGDKTMKPYALAVSDLNLDGVSDIIVGHVKASSVAYFNEGTGRSFTSVLFGDNQGTVYGFDIGDFDRDGQPDIAAARSGATNIVYLANARLEK